MIKNQNVLYTILSNLKMFTSLNETVKSQFHSDEKRNVKQPPLLKVIENRKVSFYNLMIAIPKMS